MDGRWGGAVLETLTSADKFSKVMPIENGEDGLVTYDNKATTKIKKQENKSKSNNQMSFTAMHTKHRDVNLSTSEIWRFFLSRKTTQPPPPQKISTGGSPFS